MADETLTSFLEDDSDLSDEEINPQEHSTNEESSASTRNDPSPPPPTPNSHLSESPKNTDDISSGEDTDEFERDLSRPTGKILRAEDLLASVAKKSKLFVCSFKYAL